MIGKLISSFLILSLLYPYVGRAWNASPLPEEANSLARRHTYFQNPKAKLGVEADDFLSEAAKNVSLASFEDPYYGSRQATLSLINNQGDPLETFKDLGSKQNIRSLASNMAVAAILGTGGVPEGADFVDHLTANLSNNIVSNAAAITIQKQDLKEAWKEAIKSTVANTIQGYLAGKIGQNRGSMDFLSHKLAHSVLGAVVGAGLTKDWAEGAIAGGMGGLISETIAESLPNNIDKEMRANMARMGTAVAALLAGQNVNVANFTGDNSLKYNFMKSSEPNQDAQDVKKEKEEEEKKEEKKAKQEVKADKAVTSEDVKLHATKGKKETFPSSSTSGSDKKQLVKNNPQTAPPVQNTKNNTEKPAQEKGKATSKITTSSKELAKATSAKPDTNGSKATKKPVETKPGSRAAAKPAQKAEKEKPQVSAKNTKKTPTQAQAQTNAASSDESLFEPIFNINRPTFAEKIGVASNEETGATYRAIPQNKPSIQNVFNWGTEGRQWLEETASNYPRATSIALQTVEMGAHMARGTMYAAACLGGAAVATPETLGFGGPLGCVGGMMLAFVGEHALGHAVSEGQQKIGDWAESYGTTPEEALNNRLTMEMGVGLATLPLLALTKGKGSSSLELLLTESNALARRPMESSYYSTIFQAKLKKDQHFSGKPDRLHFQESNRQFYEMMQRDTQFKQAMETAFPGIGNSVRPFINGNFPSRPPIGHGLTWHHNAYEPGLMELIPRQQHIAPGSVQKNLHPNQEGGMKLWGGGRNSSNANKER